MNRFTKGMITGLIMGTVLGMYTVVRRTPLLYYRFQMRRRRVGNNVLRTLKRVSGAVSCLGRIGARRSYNLLSKEEDFDRQVDHVRPLA